VAAGAVGDRAIGIPARGRLIPTVEDDRGIPDDVRTRCLRGDSTQIAPST
jgi:hypothetical protein